MAISERLRLRIAALRVKYVGGFGEEIDGFASDLASLSEEGNLAIRQRAHRLAGTAGSYQLDGVSRAAQAVESLCEQSATNEDLTAAVESLCEQLRLAALEASSIEP